MQSRLAIIGTLLLSLSVQAQEKVAGRTVEGWAKDLDNKNEFVRLRAVKSLGPFGKKALEPLRKALDDKHPGVRYWAASHLGAIGTEAKLAIDRLYELKKDKNHPGVAMAAAFALCRIESVNPHIELLIQRLKYPERGMACASAEFLGRLGPKDGKSALPALERAFKDHERGKKGADYHVQGAAQNALRKINPNWKP